MAMYFSVAPVLAAGVLFKGAQRTSEEIIGPEPGFLFEIQTPSFTIRPSPVSKLRKDPSMPKISILGAGNVGATVAQYLLERNIADVMLIDVVDGLPQGKALDLQAAAPVRGFRVKIEGSNDPAACAGSSVIIATAGLARKPGMSRDDLLEKNAQIAAGLAREVRKRAGDAVLINVANPLDAICEVYRRVTGFPPERVLGMAGVLDSARFRAFIAAKLGVAADDVQAMVLGGHGDEMVPLVSTATVSGVPVTALLDAATIEAIVTRTRNAGAEVVKLLKTGSAFFSPGACAALMAEQVVMDQKRILPASAYLSGQYGLRDIYLGVPVVLGGGGVERIIEVPLSLEEKAALAKSAAAVKELIDKVKQMV
jgi:malate dehydrogenase